MRIVKEALFVYTIHASHCRRIGYAHDITFIIAFKLRCGNGFNWFNGVAQ